MDSSLLIKHKILHILQVEDDPHDVLLTRRALKDVNQPHVLQVIDNGFDALRYLKREDEFQSAIRPDIVLLDLNLPRMNGRQVLSEIRRDESLKGLPVVVLTTSKREEDIVQIYKLHANCYVTKSVDLKEFSRSIQTLVDFWASVVQLPTAGETTMSMGTGASS